MSCSETEYCGMFFSGYAVYRTSFGACALLHCKTQDDVAAVVSRLLLQVCLQPHSTVFLHVLVSTGTPQCFSETGFCCYSEVT